MLDCESCNLKRVYVLWYLFLPRMNPGMCYGGALGCVCVGRASVKNLIYLVFNLRYVSALQANGK